MKNNHEIRFPADKELIEALKKINRDVCSEIKRTHFYKNVFLLGFDNLKNQLIAGNRTDVLMNFLRLKKNIR